MIIISLDLTSPYHTKMQLYIDWRKDYLKPLIRKSRKSSIVTSPQTREQQERLKERIKAMGEEPIAESGKLPVPEPPQSLKSMIESGSSPNEREVWESLNDLIIERAEAIMYKGGIQALELLKADKKTIKTLEKNLKEEEAFANWLEKNNPRIAKRLMTKQLEEKEKEKG